MSRAPPRGVIALFMVSCSALGTVFMVHRGQTQEREAMRQAVYADIEKLEKVYDDKKRQQLEREGRQK